MRKRLLASLLTLGALAGCRTVVAERVVTLSIADVVAPAEVGATETLHLSVTATSGGCVRYDHLEYAHTSSTVTLRALGIDSSGPATVCTSDLRFNTVALDVAPPFTDPVTVIAEQPDGTTLNKLVAVR